MQRLRIGEGKFVLLDDEDFAVAAQHRWRDDGKPGWPYPIRTVRSPDGKTRRLPLIRTLFPALRRHERVVFANGDRLDMRRSNLNIPPDPGPDPSPLERGAMAEAFVCFDLIRQGFHVFTPFQPYSPYDLIACGPDHRPLRIQVKHRRANNGRISFSLRTIHTNTRGAVTKDFDVDRVDVIAVYCPDTDRAYYVPSTSIASQHVSLWIGADNASNTRILRGGELQKMPGFSGMAPEGMISNVGLE